MKVTQHERPENLGKNEFYVCLSVEADLTNPDDAKFILGDYADVPSVAAKFKGATYTYENGQFVSKA